MLNRVVRFALCAYLLAPLMIAQPANATASGQVIRVVATSKWPIPSPDPRGLAFDRRSHHLLISDSEVDTTPRWRGRNLFIVRRTGRLVAARSLAKATTEPEDVTWVNRAGTLYVDDDTTDRVYRFRRGPDQLLGTADDQVRTVLRTRRFGSFDPQGLGWRPKTRTLILTDTARGKVYKVRRGTDGTFGTADDGISKFSTLRFGFRYPADVVFDGRSGDLFIVSPREKVILQTTMRGRLVRRIDLSGTSIRHASGIAIAPGPYGAPHRIYIVDCGIDDDVKKTENDGRLFMLKVVHG
jgi:sugar lactone lactonase YvrE